MYVTTCWVVFFMIWVNNLGFYKECTKGWETLERILAQGHTGEGLSDTITTEL